MNAYILRIQQNLSQSEFESLSGLVSHDKRTKIQNFRFPSDAQKSLLGDALARYAICRQYGLSNENLRFGANRHGKPFLLGHPSISHNISHSGDYVVCAAGNNGPVGIDVETVKSADMKIAERFFAEDEFAYLRGHPPELQNECFCRLWTMKESYVKMLGRGLSIPLGSFSVLSGESTGNAHFCQFIENADAIGHVCAENESDANCANVDCAELVLWATKSKT